MNDLVIYAKVWGLGVDENNLPIYAGAKIRFRGVPDTERNRKRVTVEAIAELIGRLGRERDVVLIDADEYYRDYGDDEDEEDDDD